ncbi:predicted protein [Lichtheimia corymbifera JMRC:FSU:9682]|uniref:Uncharacterized protein n=1 Tax=Lichtheimia corymbifera JMRC:FSU:9682 TaxID=1263082 RepID=A0A068SEU6_9FUNG|nr:predicted protein [Lichtheimia corymbifera JMRC:FSU:9682]
MSHYSYTPPCYVRYNHLSLKHLQKLVLVPWSTSGAEVDMAQPPVLRPLSAPVIRARLPTPLTSFQHSNLNYGHIPITTSVIRRYHHLHRNCHLRLPRSTQTSTSTSTISSSISARESSGNYSKDAVVSALKLIFDQHDPKNPELFEEQQLTNEEVYEDRTITDAQESLQRTSDCTFTYSKKQVFENYR